VIGANLVRSVASAAAAIKAEVLALFAASGGAGLVGFIQASAGAVARTVQEKLRQEAVSVRDFGALGNGVTDDSAALQAALVAGGALYVPKGTYCVSTTLRLYPNTVITFHPEAVIKRTGAINYLFVNGELGNAAFASGYDGTGNLHVRGNGATIDLNSGGAINTAAFVLAHGYGIVIEGLTIRNGWMSHAIEVNSCKRVRIRNIEVRDHGSDDTANNEAIQIDYSNAAGFPAFGSWDDTPCEDVTVEDCRFINCPSGVGTHSTPPGTKHQDIRVVGCYFDNMQRVAVRPQGWVSGAIAFNFIRTTGREAIYGADNDKLDILYNDVVGSVQESVQLDDSTNARIEGNRFTGATSQADIQLLSCTDVYVLNNVIENSGQEAVWINTGTRVRVTGNRILGASQASSGSYSAVRLQSADDCVVTDNPMAKGGFPNAYSYGVYVVSGNRNCINTVGIEAGSSGRFGDAGAAAVLTSVDGNTLLWSGSASVGSLALSDDINKYDHLVVVTGAVAAGALRSAVCRGWNGPGKAPFRAGTDFVTVPTRNGQFIASVDTATQLTIGTANDPVRFIYGVK